MRNGFVQITWLLTSVAIGLFPLSVLGADNPSQDKENLQGVWQATSVIDDDRAEPADRVSTLTLTIKGDEYIYGVGDHSFAATFTLDASKQPARMDVTFFQGPQSGKLMSAIYSLKGDELKICVGKGQRPTDFVPKVESQAILFVFQRDKPSKDITGAEILDYGIYGGTPVSKESTAKPADPAARVEIMHLEKQTQTVPATLNTRFGFRFIIRGNSKGKLVKIKQVILCPPVTDMDTGKVLTRMEEDGAVGLDDQSDVGLFYAFDSPSELVPGPWTLQIFDHDKKLLEKTFDVVKP